MAVGFATIVTNPAATERSEEAFTDISVSTELLAELLELALRKM